MDNKASKVNLINFCLSGDVITESWAIAGLTVTCFTLNTTLYKNQVCICTRIEYLSEIKPIDH